MITIQPVAKEESIPHPETGEMITVPGRSPYPYHCDENGNIKKQTIFLHKKF